MFRARLHPTPAGLLLGLAVVALWAAMWIWFLTQIASVPQSAERRRSVNPELAAAYFWTAPVKASTAIS